MNTHTLEKRYGHAGGVDLNAEAFAAALRAHMKLAGRHVSVRLNPMRLVADQPDDVYVHFVNLPEEVVARREGGGAEAENNRATFWIRGFGHAGALAPTGKVRVETGTSVFRPHKLRAKTAPAAVIAKYLGDFISKIVAEVPPHFTHTR